MPGNSRHLLKRATTLPFRRDLDRLARAHHTDKASTEHGYTQFYAQHLPPRHSVTALLEIGIGGFTSITAYEEKAGGMSLRMWQDYFPNAHIVGLDLYEKEVPGPRIHVERGSQDDPSVLGRIADRYGPFDVIIDDGSHIGRHQWTSFRHLFSAVKPGGTYIIEDLATAYNPGFEGGGPGTPGTSVALLKDAVDHVLRRHWGGADAPAIAEVHVYDEIAFLTRADSTAA